MEAGSEGGAGEGASVDGGTRVGFGKVTVGRSTVSVRIGVSLGICCVGNFCVAAGITELPHATNITENIERIIKRFIASNLIS
jgi:hypothetical protein